MGYQSTDLKKIDYVMHVKKENKLGFPSNQRILFLQLNPYNFLPMDLFGPSRTMSFGGNYYALVIVNDYSRFTWALFLIRKKDVSYPNFVRGPLLDDMRPFFGPCKVLGTHH